MLVIKGRLRKMWAFTGRKQGTRIPGIWTRLRYLTRFLPQPSPTNAPAALHESQETKAGTGRMRNCPLLEKISFETIRGTHGPDELQLQVLRELAAEAPKPRPTIFEKLW